MSEMLIRGGEVYIAGRFETTDVLIRDGKIAEKRTMALPQKLTNIIFCKNPRCITTTEQELPHVFQLTDAENKVYRCIYCESQAE